MGLPLLYWQQNLDKSGQSMCDVTPKLINMLNTYDFVAPGATKSHTSLDNIVSLGNRITYQIVYDFRRDRTTVELCSWKMHGETNLMITYDVTESCPDLPDCVIARQLGNSLRQHISPHKFNYGFSKKFETAELRTFSITMKKSYSVMPHFVIKYL